MNVFLEVTGVTKRFGGNYALNDVSVAVGDDELVGLIGPNGSGKSTLLNVMSGVHRATAGTVTIDGIDCTRARPERRARKGLARTFQHEMSYPRLTVKDNLRIAMEQAGGRPTNRELADALSYVGLPDGASGQEASDLSWGQGRMLGIAMAIAMQPRVILLDEPFAGLQSMAAKHIVGLLRKISADGVGMVIVEHEMSLLLPLCDRVVVLAAGSVIAEGEPDDVMSHASVIEAYFGTAI